MIGMRSKHWMEGGTGITNFDIKDKPIYDLAVKTYNERYEHMYPRNLVVSDLPMDRSYQRKLGSLHALSDPIKDLGYFWAVYAGVDAAMKAQEKKPDPKPLTATEVLAGRVLRYPQMDVAGSGEMAAILLSIPEPKWTVEVVWTRPMRPTDFV